MTARVLIVDDDRLHLKVLAKHVEHAGYTPTLAGTELGFVGRVCGPKRDRVQTLAFWIDGAFAPDLTYDLDGTPCQSFSSTPPALSGTRQRISSMNQARVASRPGLPPGTSSPGNPRGTLELRLEVRVRALGLPDVTIAHTANASLVVVFSLSPARHPVVSG